MSGKKLKVKKVVQQRLREAAINHQPSTSQTGAPAQVSTTHITNHTVYGNDDSSTDDDSDIMSRQNVMDIGQVIF